MNKREALNQFMAHFDSGISQDIRDYANNDVLLHSRYIFTKRSAGVQFGYCTHCRSRYQSGSLKHNSRAVCPKCNSKCTVKASGISRKYLYDSGYLVYYEKSKVNPQAIVARGFHVSRSYTGSYVDVDTKFTQRAMYVFEPGKPQMRESWGSGWHERGVTSCYSTSQSSNNNCSIDSIKKAIQGTSYQYSTWDWHEQPQGDYVKFFELFSNYPAVEYLAKFGFSQFIEAKLFYRKTYGAINWSGKSIDKVLRIGKNELREIRDFKNHLDTQVFRLYQISRKEMNPPALSEINAFIGGHSDVMGLAKQILKHVTVRQFMNYTQKQHQRSNRSIRDVLIAWGDYLAECEQLDYDFADERIVRPPYLFSAHRKTSQLVQHKKDELLDQKITRRLELLNELIYENDEFVIRPAQSTWELIYEGKQLSICVGSYAKDYANGKTNILLIRRKCDLETPFFTVEIRSGEVRQVQGQDHCSSTKDVKEFMDDFKKAKLTKTKKPVRQGVAV